MLAGGLRLGSRAAFASARGRPSPRLAGGLRLGSRAAFASARGRPLSAVAARLAAAASWALRVCATSAIFLAAAGARAVSALVQWSYLDARLVKLERRLASVPAAPRAAAAGARSAAGSPAPRAAAAAGSTGSPARLGRRRSVAGRGGRGGLCRPASGPPRCAPFVSAGGAGLVRPVSVVAGAGAPASRGSGRGVGYADGGV